MRPEMTSRERVLNACNRKGYDRILIKHEGTPEVNQMIKEHLGLKNDEQLLLVLGDDFRYVEAKYNGPELKTFPDGSIEGYFGEKYKYTQFEGEDIQNLFTNHLSVSVKWKTWINHIFQLLTGSTTLVFAKVQKQ